MYLQFIAIGLLICSNLCLAQIYPIGFKKISSTEGGLQAMLTPGAQFGIASGAIGDLDNDGVIDLAIGATNQGGTIVGAAYVLFMNSDGSVKNTVQINNTEPASQLDSFGSSICGLGDLDGDGVEDIGVGAGYDSDGGFQAGAFWILFMNTNGTVKSHQKISSLAGGFSAPLIAGNVFGTGAATLGDLDGDGIVDIAVGARNPGAVYILFLNTNGTVKNWNVISPASGLPIDPGGLFGYGIGTLGDVDGDGITDLAIGGHRSDVGFVDSGAVFIVFLTTSGGVKGFTRISPGFSNFNDMSAFILGVAITGIGDYDTDGVRDMVVSGSDGSGTGAIWYMMLNSNGTVKSSYKISGSTGNTNLSLDVGDFFGGSLCFLQDINGDGLKDIVAGAFQDDDGSTNNGALWISIPPCTSIDAGPSRNICSIQSIVMNAITRPGATGTWTTTSGSGQFSSINSPISSVSNLGIGTNIFRWTVTSLGCVSVYDEVDIVVDPVVKPNAGSDQLLCYPKTNATLSANNPPAGTATWTLLKGRGEFLNINSANTSIANLGVGENSLKWQFLSSSYCPAQQDTVVITVVGKLDAIVSSPDSTFSCGEQEKLHAIKPINGDGLWEITKGNASITDPADPMTLITFSEKGKPVTATWKVTYSGCPGSSDDATYIPYDVNNADLPNVITPNGDGKNDSWKILNLNLQKNVSVYNRWGDLVFSDPNYKNNWSGANLSPGVYYYLLRIYGCSTELKGSLTIVH